MIFKLNLFTWLGAGVAVVDIGLDVGIGFGIGFEVIVDLIQWNKLKMKNKDFLFYPDVNFS